MWQATTIDEYSRVRAANIGATAATRVYSTTVKIRYSFGGSCEREVAGSTITQTIWIGGDAYTAVAVAKKTGTRSWTIYNIFRDLPGTIIHLKTGSTFSEYSFDSWGHRRDKDDSLTS